MPIPEVDEKSQFNRLNEIATNVLFISAIGILHSAREQTYRISNATRHNSTAVWCSETISIRYGQEGLDGIVSDQENSDSMSRCCLRYLLIPAVAEDPMKCQGANVPEKSPSSHFALSIIELSAN
jgi:hypothetical protein